MIQKQPAEICCYKSVSFCSNNTLIEQNTDVYTDLLCNEYMHMKKAENTLERKKINMNFCKNHFL